MERVALLVIDPAKLSGWSFGVVESAPRLANVNHGEIEHTRQQRDRVVDNAVSWADAYEAPLVVVMETWLLHGKWGNDQKLGMGAAAGRWLDSIEYAAIPDRRVHRVNVGRWRRELFGKQGRKMDGDAWRKLAMERAPDWASRPIIDQRRLRENEAEALCILKWAHMRHISGQGFEGCEKQ